MSFDFETYTEGGRLAVRHAVIAANAGLELFYATTEV